MSLTRAFQHLCISAMMTAFAPKCAVDLKEKSDLLSVHVPIPFRCVNDSIQTNLNWNGIVFCLRKITLINIIFYRSKIDWNHLKCIDNGVNILESGLEWQLQCHAKSACDNGAHRLLINLQMHFDCFLIDSHLTSDFSNLFKMWIRSTCKTSLKDTTFLICQSIFFVSLSLSRKQSNAFDVYKQKMF